MSLPSYAVSFRGRPACPCLATWLPFYEAELQRRGILHGPLPIMQLIGGADASAGSHTKGGAFDTRYLGDSAVWVARQMGADATWHRLYDWDGHNGGEHEHGVLTGCPHALQAPVAANQIPAVRAGFNGLGHLGRGGKDTGPRPLSGRTWEQGIAWAHQQEDDMPYTDWPEQDRKALAEDVADAVLGRKMKAFGNLSVGTIIKNIARKVGAADK